MPINQTTPDQAKEALDQDSKALYLDVRSIEEFEAGHPEGSINIPLMHQNPGGGMIPNPDFLQVADKVLPKDKKLYVGCLRGGRSMKACQLLESRGYSDLTNVHGGFGGAIDPATGQITQKGWKDLGLPVSIEGGEGISYESLKTQAS